MIKTGICASFRLYILSAFLLCYPVWTLAVTNLTVFVYTGGDDLRGGNNAFINLVLIDGRVLTEQILSTGERYSSIKQITFPETVSASEIRSFRIRHDGNPRHGYPLDTYDNWNLNFLFVDMESPFVDMESPYCGSTGPLTLYPIFPRGGIRFTSELRQFDFALPEPIPSNWCTHSGAQRLDGDLNGDGWWDAVCHDRNTGEKWVALSNFAAGLVPAWEDATSRWCSHRGAALYIGDVNGDLRADLICKDADRIWLDFVGDGVTSFFGSPDGYVDTTWCNRADDTLFVSDMNGDSRADLVCRSSDGTYAVEHADSSGQFQGIPDTSRRAPDFEITDIVRSGKGYSLTIRNNGAAGSVTDFSCWSDTAGRVTAHEVIRIPPGRTRTKLVSPVRDVDFISCWAGQRGKVDPPEIFTLNNSLSKCFR